MGHPQYEQCFVQKQVLKNCASYINIPLKMLLQVLQFTLNIII
jgi:hypothetical protein